MVERIAISGYGLVTPLGNGIDANLEALKAGRTGTVVCQEWKDLGNEVTVGGAADREVECPLLNQKNKRFMSPNTRFAVAAAYEAVINAGFTVENLPKDRTALVNGCAGSSYATVFENAYRYYETRRLRAVSPFTVPRTMPSSAVASLSLLLGIRGESYDISAACTSGAIALINACRLLLTNEYDFVLAGGSEELSWVQAVGFSAMKALSRAYADAPETASRPFDKSRDGFVLGEGAGMMLLERESTAKARGHKPFGYIAGFASNSNSKDMVVPDAESSADVMKKAIANAGLRPEDIDYINTHGTATPVGDPVEMEAMKMVFGEGCHAAINSTKSMTGHMVGASGAVEAIFSALQMNHSFVAPTANLKDPEDAFAWANLPRKTIENADLHYALSNSFGFGGSNACIILARD